MNAGLKTSAKSTAGSGTVVHSPVSGHPSLRSARLLGQTSPAQEKLEAERSQPGSINGHAFDRIDVLPAAIGRVQPKLAIGRPNDRFEREADQVAERVLAAEPSTGPIVDHPPAIAAEPDPGIRRQMAIEQDEDDDEDEEETLQAKEAPGQTPRVTPSVESGLTEARGSGQPLADITRTYFEPRFGYDFGGVRIHTDPRSAEVARNLNALAFTQGQDIFFGDGQYRPDAPDGSRLLAHELTHTLQQRTGPTTPASSAVSVADPGARSLTQRQAALLEAPPEPQPTSREDALPSTAEVNAIAAEIVTSLQADPEGSSEQVEQRLSGLDWVIREAVVRRARAQLDPVGRDQLSLITERLTEPTVGATGAASVATAPTRDQSVSRERTPQPTSPRPEAQRAAASAGAGAGAGSPTLPLTGIAPAEPTAEEAVEGAELEKPGAETEKALDEGAEGIAAVEAKATEEESQAAEGEAADGEGGPRLADLVEPLPELPGGGPEESFGDAVSMNEPAFGGFDAPSEASVASEEPGFGAFPSEIATSAPVDTEAESHDPMMARAEVDAISTSLMTAPETAQQTIQASTETIQAEVAAAGAATRAAVRSQVAAAVAALRADFGTKRTELQASITAAQAQIDSQHEARRSEATSRGEDASQHLTTLFQDHHTNIDTAVQNNIAAAEALRTTYVSRLQTRTSEQAGDARQRGQALGSTYPNSARGGVQRSAAIGVANETAKEMEDREPEAVQAVEEITVDIPDEIRRRGQEALDGFDKGLPDLLGHVDRQTEAAETALSGLADRARQRMQAQGDQLLAQLDAAETAAIARAGAIGPQAEAQIRSGERAALARIGSIGPDAMGRISQLVDEAVGILAAADAPDVESSRQFADQVQTFVTAAANETGLALQEAGTGFAAEFQKAEPATQQGLQAVRERASGELQAMLESANAAISTFVEGVDKGYEETIDSLDESFTDIETQASDGLEQAVRALQTGFDKVLADAEAKILEAVNKGLAKNTEALGKLDGQMREAASDAAWDYDHPILSTLADIGMIVLGVIAGILMVLALVVVAIVAFKLIVAGLIVLGVTALVANIIVAAAGLALLGYGIYQAYQARVQGGQSGWAALGGAVLDITGITDIGKAFTEPGLSPFERGFSFGKGIATLGTFFVGKRINARVNAKLPASITNPSRGAAWRWLGGGTPRGLPAPPAVIPPPAAQPRALPTPAAGAPATAPPLAQPRALPGLTPARPAPPAAPPGNVRPITSARPGAGPPSRLQPGRQRDVTSLESFRQQRAARPSGRPPTEPATQARPVAAEAAQTGQVRLAAGAERFTPSAPPAPGARSPLRIVASGGGRGGRPPVTPIPGSGVPPRVAPPAPRPAAATPVRAPAASSAPRTARPAGAAPPLRPAPRINARHVFHGEINARGRAVGFHHRGSIGHEARARIVAGTQSGSNAQGVYRARVEVINPTNGRWVAKGPASTFFPDGWSRGRVIAEIRGAFGNQTLSRGNYWEGVSPSGVRIGGYTDVAGNINTAYPLWP